MSFSFEVELPRPEHVKYKSNYISTTKYNVFTYLPLSLILQFKRYANIYFLVCAVLQSIPLLSPLNPASAVLPLIFVLALSMIREGV
jgi:phospholipid-transporting ATPase